MRKLSNWFGNLIRFFTFGIEIRVYEGFWNWILGEEEFGV
jgi:hypothetical protein